MCLPFRGMVVGWGVKAVPFPIVTVAAAAVALAAAGAVRLEVLEVPAIGWRCAGESAPAWCLVSAGLGWLLRNQGLGAFAVIVAGAALLRSSRLAVAAAAATATAALVLYNAELGASALLLASLRAVRL